MAGRGPAPKPAHRRARRNKSNDLKVITIEPEPQPALPEGYPWPDETLQWWQMWKDSPLSEDFTTTDWAFLLDTALLHATLWGNGDLTVLAELRIRVAKFGATPEDRARLRIQFAQADEIEDRVNNRQVPSARERMRKRNLKVVGD